MILLKFETPIKGSCKIKGYEDWIILESYAFHIDRRISTVNDSRAPVVTRFSELTCSKKADIASNEMFIQSFDGKSLVKGTLVVINTGGKANNVSLTMELGEPIITSYVNSFGDGEAEGRPLEAFTINFETFSYEYDVWDGNKVTKGTPKKWNLLTGEQI